MDRDLEEQIDEIIQKTTREFKSKIVKIIIKNQNKLLKDQARELKENVLNNRKSITNNISNGRKPSTKESSLKKSSFAVKKDRDRDRDDSDEYSV